MFRIRWFRRLVRRNTNPMSPDYAIQWRKRLSIAYMLVSWNLGGLVLYMCITGRSDWPAYYGLKSKEEADQKSSIFWAEKLGIKSARVVSMKGLSVTSDVQYENEDNRSLKDIVEEHRTGALKKKENMMANES